MKLFKNILVIILITAANGIYAQETKGKVFSHYRELGEYAFSNTNLNDVTTGYFFDYAFGLYDDLTILDLNPRTDSTNADKMLAVLKLVEDADINEKFKVDTMLFPFMYGFYAANGQNALTIPLVITDIDMSVLKKDKKQMITEWEREEPFPKFYSYDFYQTNVFNASLFCDTFVYNNIQLYWTDETFVSNTEREVEHVYITAHNQTIEIPKSQPVSISHLYDENRPLKHLKITVEFSDGTTKETYQNVWLQKNTNQEELPETKSAGDGGVIYGDLLADYAIYHTLEWKTYYGCNDENTSDNPKLDKPYIYIAGWGPFTGLPFINLKYNFYTTFPNQYNKQNISGLIDSLTEANYDVVLVKFTPPNVSIINNVELLIQLINKINTIKNSYGSYEENIIHGQSAGALGAKLALLKMEYEHLNNNGPHHQTKLFISHDGENQGANIPLGMQGTVEYLYSYANLPNIPKTIEGRYILHFIINAVQSKELLKYHYSNSNPQSVTPERQNYLNAHTQYNHSKNSHIPNYPAFCRNISSSNGQPISDISNNYSNHIPYTSNHPNEGDNFLRAWNYNALGYLKKELVANYSSTANTAYPFYYKKKVSGYWSWEYYIKTHNALNLDNAPGGTMFEKVNPQYDILKLMGLDLSFNGAGDFVLIKPGQYCFTPTIFTHDIKNYNFAANNNRLHYNFYRKRLMFQTEQQANLNQQDFPSLSEYNDYLDHLKTSNYYGYPHLGVTDHYGTTPFDALFCSTQRNTEHLTFNYANGNPVNLDGEEPNPDSSIYRDPFMSWILGEADVYNSYLQNRKYGYNARSNYTYIAHINSPHKIYIGNHVTQRTDFKDVEINTNGELICKAAEKIIIKPGFKTEAGAKFVAKIQPYGCNSTKSTINDNPYLGSVEMDNDTENVQDQANNNGDESIVIYPNPTNHSFTINTHNDLPVIYKIYNLQGKLVQQGNTKNVNINLAKGLYVVVVQVNNKISKHKLIVN